MVRSILCSAALLALILTSTGCGSKEGDGAAVTNSIPGGSADASPTSSGKGSAPAERVDPTVRFETTMGSFTVKLDQQHAPLTVENFLNYVETGHYDQTLFHQVVEGYMILGGGFNTDYSEKPTQTAVRNEAHNGLSNKRGTIAMARQSDVIDSSTCQFFINLSDNTDLDHKSREVAEYGYCVFGQVTEGLDVIEKIGKTQVRNVQDFEMTPSQAVIIKTARRVR